MLDMISQAITKLFAVINGTLSALSQTYEQLNTFNETIDGMISDMSTGTSATGVPVTEAIGTIRYCVGDALFFTIYLIILFGILFTIVKLAMIAYEQVIKIGDIFTNLGGRQGIIDKIKSLFSGFE